MKNEATFVQELLQHPLYRSYSLLSLTKTLSLNKDDDRHEQVDRLLSTSEINRLLTVSK
jgi:hypothetical protein